MSSPKKKRKGSEVNSRDLPEPEDIERRIEQLKLLGQKVKEPRKRFNAYKRALKKDGQRAVDQLDSLRSSLSNSFDSWRKDKMDMAGRVLELSIQEAADSGIDVSKVRSKLKKTDSGKVSIDSYEKKMESLSSDMESLFEDRDDLLSRELFPSFMKAVSSYEEITGTEATITDHRKYFRKLGKLIQKGDIKNILVFSNLLYTTIQSDIGEDLSKDRFKSIEEEVKGLMETMDDFRHYGLRQESAERELEKLRKGLDQFNYQEAKATLNRLNKNISRTEKEYFRRKGSVSLLDAEDLIQEYGSLIDLEPQSKKLQELRDDVTNTSPRKFMEQSHSILDEVKDILHDNFKDQVDQRLEIMDQELKRADGLSEEKRKTMLDLRNSIQTSIENRDISEAMEFLSLAESQMGITGGEVSLLGIKDRYVNLMDEMEGLVTENLEIGTLEQELSEMEEMFLDDDLRVDKLVDRVETGEQLVSERMTEIRKSEFKDTREEMLSLLNSIDMKPEKRSAIIEKLNETEELLSELEDEGYREKMESIKEELNREVSNYYRENYNNIVSDLQEKVSKLEVDMNVREEMESRMENAGVYFRERDYLASGDMLMDIDHEIRDIVHNKEISEAEELISSAEFMFEEARRAGVDVSDQSNLLSNAKSLLRDGDLEGSMELASLVESSVKNRWMDSKRKVLRDDIDKLRDVFDESSELGLDIEDASDLLNEAEDYFEQEKFEEVNDRVFRAKETIEERRKEFYSQNSMESISSLKKEIEELNEMGLNTVEVETMMVEAERMFMDQDYETSYSMTLDVKDHLNFLKESYMEEDIPSRMDDLAKQVGKLEMMGLDTELARSYLDEATSNFDSGNLIDTMSSLNKASEISDEIHRSHVSVTIPETIVDVQREIENASLEGLEIEGVQDLLDEAEDMFNREDYDQAMETIQRARETFTEKRDDYYRNKYEDNLELVEKIMGGASGLDNEVELSRDNINIARDAYERGDFETSHNLMTKVIKFLERSMENRESSKRKEVVQTYYDEVNTLISVAEAENIDVTEERKLFGIAGDLLVNGDFDQSEHVLEGIKVGLNEKRMQMKRRLIESSIQTTEILLDNMNEMGMDTSRERGLMDKMKEALRRGDLDLCDEINSELQAALQDNKGPYMVQKVQNEISDLRGKMVEASTVGADVESVRNSLSRANEMFEKGDLEGAKEAVEEGRESLDLAKRAYDEKGYREVLEDLNTHMEQLRKMGIPTDDEEEMISIAESRLADGNVGEATSFLETALIGATAKMNSFQSTTAEGYMNQIENYLDDLKDAGVDIEDLVRIFQEGIELHKSGKDDEAVNKFSSILELGEEIRTNKEINEIRSILHEQKSLYQDLVSVGMKKSKKLSGTIDTSLELIEKDDVDTEKLSSAVKKVGSLLKKRSRPYMEKLVKKHISEARKGMHELSEKGEDISGIKEMIKEAASTMRSGEVEAAEEKIQSLLDDIEKKRLEETQEVLKGEIGSVKQMLTRLKTLGSDVSTPEKLLSRAEVALMEGKAENAENLIKSVRKAVKDIVKRNMRETALETIEFVDAMIHYLIDNFSGISSKLTGSESLLDEARNLFKEKKFKAAKAKAEEARKSIEKMDMPNIEQFFYVFQSSQATEMSKNVEIGIAELRNKGIDTSKVQILYDKAQEHFAADEFERGRQMITLARIMLAEIDQQSLRDKAFDELNSAHVEILTRKRQGVNIGSAYRIYNNAKEAFSMREYKKAVLLAKKAAYQARKS